VGIEQAKEAKRMSSGVVKIDATEDAFLKPRGIEERHPEAIGEGFVAKSGSGELWPDSLAGWGKWLLKKLSLAGCRSNSSRWRARKRFQKRHIRSQRKMKQRQKKKQRRRSFNWYTAG
jgi:hypothetical protein